MLVTHDLCQHEDFCSQVELNILRLFYLRVLHILTSCQYPSLSEDVKAVTIGYGRTNSQLKTVQLGKCEKY